MRGGIDVHVHIAPDVVERRIDDVGLARRCKEVGLAGFVLKSHYTSTAERAAVVRGVVPGIAALGAIVLNRAIGGMNPLAVEIAAREGARVVWMPTTDSLARARAPGGPAARARTCRCGRRSRPSSASAGSTASPCRRWTRTARCGPRRAWCCDVIAEHGMVLATGHLGRDEVFPIVAAAVEAGVSDVVVTHPDFPAQDFSVEEQLELAGMGAWIERCFTTPHTGKCSWEQWIGARAPSAPSARSCRATSGR